MKFSAALNYFAVIFLGCFAASIVACRPPAKPADISKVSINVATFCDSAVDDDGKLDIRGTFDTLFVSQFPAVHPTCSLVVRLNFAKEEFREHRLNVKWFDPQGDSFVRDIDAPVDAKSKTAGETSITKNVTINLTGLKFEAAGIYLVQLFLDDQPLITLPLSVRLKEKASK